VVRGSVRLVAAAATRLRPIEARHLVPSNRNAWHELGAVRERNVTAVYRRVRLKWKGTWFIGQNWSYFIELTAPTSLRIANPGGT
jgi:hypothetical protein